MGYTTSRDMKSQIRLTFATRGRGDRLCRKERHRLSREEPKESKRRQISYSDNFRYDRRTPWTH
jgi:hypothetical protein